MMFRTVHILLVVLFTIVANQAAWSAGDEFPGRVKYPDIPYIELDDLYAKQLRNEVYIVDARSNYEYETLRIKGAVNIPVANEDAFVQEVTQLRQKTDKPIVFYCNGHTCMKSYIATDRAMKAGVDDVIAFDAGIFDWTKKYPKQAVLLGNSPVNPNQLIAKKHFKSRLLDPDTFSSYVMDTRDRIVVDVRDKFQRAGVGFYPGIERWAALDDRKKLQRYIQRAKRENKTLFIYDEVGKQVRWLQYALEEAGVRNYYFMEKGARAYYDMMAKIEWGQ
ncbi:MAG: rhodanese-like domain-containing protein [Gammaproteobacteria bacterium]|jgi:rhodanese-related sulfurtransferase